MAKFIQIEQQEQSAFHDKASQNACVFERNFSILRIGEKYKTNQIFYILEKLTHFFDQYEVFLSCKGNGARK